MHFLALFFREFRSAKSVLQRKEHHSLSATKRSETKQNRRSRYLFRRYEIEETKLPIDADTDRHNVQIAKRAKFQTFKDSNSQT
mmetsp:Transcript_1292/g.2125  ORF Transcript_1292/g.2125 Transcript_1292/m.2125 type:complete len:84 (+) Transcript_1292:18-269(+)